MAEALERRKPRITPGKHDTAGASVMDYPRIASELLRALRGKRSQQGFSRRLGYRSNVVYAWERGRAWPSASRFFAILERLGHPADRVVERFYRQSPPWLSEGRPVDAAGVARLLNDLRGSRAVVDLARSSGRSRFRLARWLSGETEPRLPDLLHMIQLTSLRLLDFLATFLDPSKLSSIANEWRLLEAARRTAYGAPWSHAVLRTLELEQYRALPAHVPGWIAAQIGITREQEKECLRLLASSGQISEHGGHWVVPQSSTVDTRADPKQALELKAFWAKVAADRLHRGAEGLFSYNLFCVSRADLERLKALHRAYFRELRAIVGASSPAECVALASINLLELVESEPRITPRPAAPAMKLMDGSS